MNGKCGNQILLLLSLSNTPHTKATLTKLVSFFELTKLVIVALGKVSVPLGKVWYKHVTCTG